MYSYIIEDIAICIFVQRLAITHSVNHVNLKIKLKRTYLLVNSPTKITQNSDVYLLHAITLPVHILIN